ncbi:MAG TPA: ABC transporter permease [Actinomycetales bacterium]|jgi:lipooligosaccharide transport system permease protein
MALTRTAPASAPQSPPAPVLRVLSYFLLSWRRVWRGTVFSGFVGPLLFLGAFGFGLGSLVDGAGDSPLGVPFLQFVAPGVLAATAMQTAVGESTYPVLGAIKWQRNYHAMLATPLSSDSVAFGHLAFIVVRCTAGATVFLAVAALLGAVPSWWGVLALPAAALVGLAHAAPIYLLATRVENDVAFALVFRLVMTPLFLFSGTFFPISQLPGWLEPLAWFTPLWHGVELARAATLGNLQLGSSLGHLGFLLAWCAVFTLLARQGLRRRMVV